MGDDVHGVPGVAGVGLDVKWMGVHWRHVAKLPFMSDWPDVVLVKARIYRGLLDLGGCVV